MRIIYSTLPAAMWGVFFISSNFYWIDFCQNQLEIFIYKNKKTLSESYVFYNLINMKKKAFTLFEIVLALIIFSLMIGIIFNIYINTKKSERNILKQQLLVWETNDLLDKIDNLSLDYTIDYQEYFNRGVVWCVLDWDPLRSNTWSCDIFTSYWNSWNLYYCSNLAWDQSLYNYYNITTNWCIQSWIQKFGQYTYQFRNITDWMLNNWNDVFLWAWPISVHHNTWVQELYLINNNWDHRVFFRRHFVTWVDLNWDWFITWKNESLYTIQILKLKWFDAWGSHNFDSPDQFTNDWFIDTRACDYSNWFICSWSSIWSWIYSWYNLPSDSDDGRVNLIDAKITISDWNIEVRPVKDPYLAVNEPEHLLDPYITIALTANIYWHDSNEEISLQTSIWFKNSYFNRKEINYTGFLP